MDEATYRSWWPLHLRAVRGETLTPPEQAEYQAGLDELRRTEPSPGNSEALQAARSAMETLEAEQAQLRRRRDELAEEIAALEAALRERRQDKENPAGCRR
jgi:chromosome segregation ATPase